MLDHTHWRHMLPLSLCIAGAAQCSASLWLMRYPQFINRVVLGGMALAGLAVGLLAWRLWLRPTPEGEQSARTGHGESMRIEPPSAPAHDPVADERRRIALQLHDRVAGPLVLAIAECQSCSEAAPQLILQLEKCLFNLHTSVDQMAAEDMDAAMALAQLRQRVEPLLRRRGIQMVWQTCPTAAAPALAADAVEHLQLIVQEALCNVLQHSQAQRVWVRSYWVADVEWIVEIENDGVPFSATRYGQGIKGMQRRAHSMPAQLHLIPKSNGGFLVRLSIRLPPVPPPGA